METVYLVMDLVEGDSIYKYVQTHSINVSQVKSIMRQLLLALEYLHSSDISIAHRYLIFILSNFLN